MSGELLNMDKSVQIETNYNKCGIVELYRFEVLEVLTEGEGGEEYNMLSLDQSQCSGKQHSRQQLGQWLPLCRVTYSLWSEQRVSVPKNVQLICVLKEWQMKGK
jgi:hypothetical protein